MEFPLFPVFLHAAVQTPPVSWGWAGLGKSACLPITHLAALEREQSTQTHGAWCLHGEKGDKVCLFSTSSLSFFLLTFSGLSLSGTNTHWDGPTICEINITRTVYSALVSVEASTGVVHQCGWQYTGGPFSVCSGSPFMHPSTLVFVHWALLWPSLSQLMSSPSLYSLHRYED